jgi:hypothetical protein
MSPERLPTCLYFTGSAAKLVACLATQMQSGGGILSVLITDNQQAVGDDENRGAPMSTGMPSRGLIWKESEDKVSWIEKPSQRLTEVAQGDFASRAPCPIQAMYFKNTQPAGVLELAKLQRTQPQSR